MRREDNKMISKLTRMMALAVVTLLMIGHALASPAINISPSSTFRPRGMVRIQLVPGGPIDYWIADGASGLCRLDNGVANLTTCFLNATAEPFDDRPNSPYIFSADESGGGVQRFTFGPDPNLPGHSIIATQENILGVQSGITFIGAPARRVTTTSAKIGPDGNLYVTFFGTGNIVRITNPRAPGLPGPATQKATIVARSSNGKRLFSQAWIGNDVWLVQAGFMERIQNATACKAVTVTCTGVLQFQNLQFPVGLASDGTRFVYSANGAWIVQIDTSLPGLSPSIFKVVSWGGPLTPGGPRASFALPRGLNIHPANANFPSDPGGDIFVTDAITIEAPAPAVAGPRVRDGRGWVIPSNWVAETSCPNNFIPNSCTFNGPVGIGTPLTPNPKAPIAATRAILRATGITHPRGLVFLGTHFWVSDEAQGFCRVDAIGAGAAALTNCYKPVNGFIPGQAAADSLNNVYVPDVSGNLGGIARLAFNTVLETVSQSGVLGQGRGTIASAVAVSPQGDLYIGPTTGQQVNKIITPATAPSAPSPVAATLAGAGVRSMVFNGNDLYMMENGGPNANTLFTQGSGQQTWIMKAAPDLSRGRADYFSGLAIFIIVGHGAPPPPTDIDTPAALALGPTGVSPCNTLVTTEPATLPSLYLGGATEVDQWSLLCTRDTVWTTDGQFSALLNLNAPIGVVTALGFAPNGSMAIGDDPSLFNNRAGLNSTTLAPTSGQGHIYIVP